MRTRLARLNLRFRREGRGVLPAGTGKGLAERTRLDDGAGRDVCAGNLNPQVNAIVERLCGSQVSSSLVSKATAELDPCWKLAQSALG